MGGGEVSLALALGLVASTLMGAVLQPRPVPPWRRPWAANATHAGIWLMAYAAELLLFGRPCFAMFNVLAIEGVIILVSLAKYDALREPFVFQDFDYFTDAIRHPRLYLPFFPWRYAVAAAVGYGAALWLGLALEPAVIHAAGLRGLAVILLLALWGWGLARVGGRRLAPTFDADDDLRRLGLLAALWAYGRAERAAPGVGTGDAPVRGPFGAVPPARTSASLPDLVTIQSESFFDVRRAYPIVKRGVLQGFDRLCAQAAMYGELDVAARGANTVRTEFAFLTGLAPRDLGVHRFNPYRKLARRGVPTVASYLRRLGYRTVCVHPYHGSFYGRDTVLPALGFDEFIDLRAFGENQKDGANIGDRALGGYVSALLQRDDPRPLYIHVITMENHGPLHLESVSAADARQVLSGPMPAGCEDLVAYARHLRNADDMFSSLAQTLACNGRPAGMCVFGDHIPIMAKVYRALGEPSGTTDALIWLTGMDTGMAPGTGSEKAPGIVPCMDPLIAPGIATGTDTAARQDGPRRLAVTSLAAIFLASAGLLRKQ
ncbi:MULTISPECIES: LTA synthase family protein [unclassified Achromobacter]|uniref:LTA synthase family protein n=1 Tax=unclassified Achromobacter TaxID=2626865 RepID=UPI000B51D335|nr:MULTISPECIES: LTA synthase family protein [unclassified Achromobacter]OWT72735.1 capsular biosynthesis protein [Achromobacter sp. HZ34]OWT73954.1 capsular biosynthesis protein [Achromobacter sp. HZ28]